MLKLHDFALRQRHTDEAVRVSTNACSIFEHAKITYYVS